MEVVETVEDEYANAAESKWISYFLNDVGAPLLNVTSGGSMDYKRMVKRPAHAEDCFCATCKSSRLYKWITKEDLSDLYDAGMSIRKIAQHYGCTAMTIHRKMIAFGIPTRSQPPQLKRKEDNGRQDVQR